MTESNPWLEEPDEVELRPDGDVEVSRIADFVTPACTVCGGMLRPDVVFFGEFIPTDKFAAAAGVLLAADALLDRRIVARRQFRDPPAGPGGETRLSPSSS